MNAALYGLNGTTSVINGMGQAIGSNILFSAEVCTDVNGHPGTFLGLLNLAGPIGMMCAGRTSDTELATFSSTLTKMDKAGMFNGHSVEIMPGTLPGSGPTTITLAGNDFWVSSFFDVFAEISIDHGSFVAGPPRTFTPTPEPGTDSLIAFVLVGVTAGELRRRTRGMSSR